MIQPNQWSCGPTALAMLLHLPTSQIIQDLGHDGSEIIWPENPEPACRRGFHIQEFLDVALKYGYWLVEIEAEPAHVAREGDPPLAIFQNSEQRLWKYLSNHPGLLVGRTSANGFRHMGYWDKKCFHDPATGRSTAWTDSTFPLTIDSFFARIKS